MYSTPLHLFLGKDSEVLIMAVIICIGGLGDCPSETFTGLKKSLENKGHTVLIPETDMVRTHKDRIALTMGEYQRIVRRLKRKELKEVPIFLLGQSAGGSAVRVVAEELSMKGDARLAGVILLSPAMPRSWKFHWLRSGTDATRRFLSRHWREILFGKMINQTVMEFEARVAPLAEEIRDRVLVSRQPVPGAEMRTLALWPPAIGVYLYPTLHLYGSNDSCIEPKAQAAFGRDLESMILVNGHVFVGAGHSLLGSRQRDEVIKVIVSWIETGHLGEPSFDLGGLKIWEGHGEPS